MPLRIFIEWVLGILLLVSAVGVILLPKPVHACLSFLVTLLALAGLYFQLSAHFIGVMQIFVYAGAILVIFMFVIVLFQDAHEQLARFQPKSMRILLVTAASALVVTMVFLGHRLMGLTASPAQLPPGYGTVQALGEALYVDFFFPFEAVILLFLVAIIGAIYIGRKEA